ncbi:T9SS type A sorting domain-containing protein [Flavobacterium pectinovorum]|uniref:T9SS type A sorting domain-containing protein n=1 Tax=Flavobacterium pectinovorum TaxID=29533 RepID=UPI001FAB6F94|nr:T9SS type A sorting domain-containing protein [Flavobacterium pectinovorum]MCI9846919.1 T9SS type A sorting domain-containing protein [Flavobacterium pectinovorum]
MKTKLLFTFLFIAIFSTSYSQQEATDYLSNLEEPSGMVNKGNILYVQGLKKLYEINTASGSPTANVIYTAETNYYMSNLTISGNIIYISEENYDEDFDTSSGCRIIALDTNNPGAPLNVIYTTTNYVSALAITGSNLYFASETTPDANDKFTVQVKKINITNLAVETVVSNLCEDEAANDMAFHNNNLLISVGNLQTVFGFDTTETVISVSQYMTNLNFNKGLFVNGNNVFIAEGNRIGTKPLNVQASLTYVAQNTFYKDNINGLFNANFRDVVLIGDKLYMTLLNQGKVVTVQDPALSKDKFNQDLKAVSISNSKTSLIVSGLESNHNATVYNLAGQLIATKKLSAGENSIDLSTFSNGVYVLQLDNQKTFKFIK